MYTHFVNIRTFVGEERTTMAREQSKTEFVLHQMCLEQTN